MRGLARGEGSDPGEGSMRGLARGEGPDPGEGSDRRAS